ncbi:hypothetical protein [Patulibacter defluvii]|uniref:hypothetical protein n=1 Tax=Patulibacter defluvii TaxID=3095358 RepID=UPI002A761A26|nr:hypothetical protein [Patulibacter sp. DM4]
MLVRRGVRRRPSARAAAAAAVAATAVGSLVAVAPAAATTVVQRASDGAILTLNPTPENRKPPRLVGFGRCPVLTPDGQTVVFFAPDDKSLLAAPAAGGPTRLLAAGVSATPSCGRQAVVSPDGSTVAAQTASRRVVVVRLADAVRTTLGTTTVSQLALAPGGGSVIVDRNARGGGIDLFSVKASKRTKRRALTNDRVSFAPTWAGGKLVYSRIQDGRSTLRSLDPRNRRTRLLIRRPKGWLLTASGIGPNGAVVVATTQRFTERKTKLVTRGPVSVGVVDVRKRRVRWLTLPAGEQPLGGVDGGAALLTITATGELVRMDLASGARTVVAIGISAAAGV